MPGSYMTALLIGVQVMRPYLVTCKIQTCDNGIESKLYTKHPFTARKGLVSSPGPSEHAL